MAAGDVNYWVGATGTQSWNVGANWSLTSVPVDDEHVVLRNATSLIDTGLAHSGVNLASFTVEDTFTGAVGDDATPLAISAVLCRVEGGVRRFNVDFGTDPVSLTVLGSGTTLDTNLNAVRIKGIDAASVVSVVGGDVGIATNTPADTATVASINATGGTLTVGRGTTWVTLTNNGGTVTVECGGTTVNNYAGDTYFEGTGSLSAVNAIGGTVYPDLRPASGATITTLNLRGGTVDTTQNPSALTIANTALRSGTITAFSPTQITHTNPSIDPGDASTFGASSST